VGAQTAACRSRTGTTRIALLWIGELGYYFNAERFSRHGRGRPISSALGGWTCVDPAEFVDGVSRFASVSKCGSLDLRALWQVRTAEEFIHALENDGSSFDSCNAEPPGAVREIGPKLLSLVLPEFLV
jgi:hypothetical protein